MHGKKLSRISSCQINIILIIKKNIMKKIVTFMIHLYAITIDFGFLKGHQRC